MSLDDVLAAYSKIGYRNFEVFTSWAKSAFDWRTDPAFYLAKGREYGLAFTSMHLPRIERDRLDETLRQAVAAARFAEAIGVEVILYKASDRPTYIKAAPAFLDSIANLRVTPAVQNHYGTPVSTLDDMKEVMEGIADRRMHALLEVGHFHSAGVPWRNGAEYLRDSIALVHIKDQIGRQSVPFGTGEIDLPGLFRHMDDRGYRGRYVVEMEVKDKENTLAYLKQALPYLERHCGITA
jgi:sugar phosphate isomerase/epimerase